jgi:hypothetical protein
MNRAPDEAVENTIGIEQRLDVNGAAGGPQIPPRRRSSARRYVFWPGLATMLLVALAIGLANWVLFNELINNRNRDLTQDGDAISMYVQALMLIWSIVSGWLLYRVDEESGKVADAVSQGDLAAFLRDAPKRTALTIRLLHLALSLLFVHSFHLYHQADWLATLEVQGGIGFLVTLTVLFIWDLEDPFHGVINVANIPPAWAAQLAAEGDHQSPFQT